MAQQDTYPSPTAAQTGSGVSPYQQTHQEPGDEHLDLNSQLQGASQHHDAHATMAGQAYNTAMNAQQLSQPAPTYGYPAATPVPFQGTIPGITGPSPQTPEDPARKKTKVTRACDECRRKKVSWNHTKAKQLCIDCVRLYLEQVPAICTPTDRTNLGIRCAALVCFVLSAAYANIRHR